MNSAGGPNTNSMKFLNDESNQNILHNLDGDSIHVTQLDKQSLKGHPHCQTRGGIRLQLFGDEF